MSNIVTFVQHVICALFVYMTKMSFICYLCKKQFQNIDLTIDHLKIIHSIKDNVNQIQCVVNNSCEKKYASFKSLRAHIKLNGPKNDQSCLNFEDLLLSDRLEHPVEPNYGFVVPVVQCESKESLTECTDCTDFFYVTNRNENTLDCALNELISDIIGLNLNDKNTDDTLKICERLITIIGTFIASKTEIRIEESSGLFGVVIRKLHPINSQRKRDKFFRESEDFIEPEDKVYMGNETGQSKRSFIAKSNSIEVSLRADLKNANITLRSNPFQADAHGLQFASQHENRNFKEP